MESGEWKEESGKKMSMTGDNDLYTADELLKECLDKIRSNAAKGCASVISTGFCNLDDLVGGFENGKVYVVGGRPAMGKGDFLLSMILDIVVESKTPALLFSTNHQKADYVSRLLSISCDIPTLHMLKGFLEAKEWDRLDKGVGVMMNAPLLIYDGLDLKLDELVEKARYGIKEKGVRIIFVDSVQMVGYASEGSPSEKISRVMFALKELARQENVPVVVGAMLRRPPEDREGLEGLRPGLSDLAYSSSIEELADVVMLVHRPTYYHIYQDIDGRDLRGMMQILVRKNALRPLGEILVRYESETGRVSLREDAWASGRWRLEELKADNDAVESLMSALDLEEIPPF